MGITSSLGMLFLSYLMTCTFTRVNAPSWAAPQLLKEERLSLNPSDWIPDRFPCLGGFTPHKVLILNISNLDCIKISAKIWKFCFKVSKRWAVFTNLHTMRFLYSWFSALCRKLVPFSEEVLHNTKNTVIYSCICFFLPRDKHLP